MLVLNYVKDVEQTARNMDAKQALKFEASFYNHGFKYRRGLNWTTVAQLVNEALLAMYIEDSKNGRQTLPENCSIGVTESFHKLKALEHWKMLDDAAVESPKTSLTTTSTASRLRAFFCEIIILRCHGKSLVTFPAPI